MRDNVTHWVAGFAGTSPFWLPPIEDVSTAAALWLPILGGIWLFVQIISKLIEIYRRP